MVLQFNNKYKNLFFSEEIKFFDLKRVNLIVYIKPLASKKKYKMIWVRYVH